MRYSVVGFENALNKLCSSTGPKYQCPLPFFTTLFVSYIALLAEANSKSKQPTALRGSNSSHSQPTKSRCLDVAREARDSVCHCTFELTLPRCQR